MSRRVFNFFSFVLFLFVFSGCATLRHAAPEDMSEDATISGMRDIRAFGGKPSEVFIKDFMSLLEHDKKEGTFFNPFPKTYITLAISGGAQNGAYGAGLLNGWSQSGTRPEFDIVTGISAGAIIAPFAFVGKVYDQKLKELFTKYSTKDIIQRKGLLHMIFGDSLVSVKPLEYLIEKSFDKVLLKKIAELYSQGRRLYVGTTDLDSKKLVIWDMGKIAYAGNDKALQLFRDIILASASIPAVFPPVFINVENGHKIYNEMHVDGSIAKDVFFIYDVSQGLDKVAKERGINTADIKFKLYVIRNGYVNTFWKEVPDTLASIAGQSYDLMTNTKSVGDIYQLYVLTKARGGDFNLAYISSDQPPQDKEFFDSVEMRRLFNIGFNEAAEGYPWKKFPPGLERK